MNNSYISTVKIIKYTMIILILNLLTIQNKLLNANYFIKKRKPFIRDKR